MTSPRRPATGAAVLRPELTEAVIEAVLVELADSGYGRLSMQRVADRAGVGKSALYRRWSGKEAMVMDVVGRFGLPDRPPPDTGSLEGDMRALVESMRAWLAHPRLGGILPDLLAESRRSPALAGAFRERLAGPRRDWSRAVLDRAGLDGADVELVVDILGSVPFWRCTVHGADIDDDQVARLAALVARGLSAG